MKNLNIIKPTDNEFLTWNDDTKQYELKLDFVKRALSVNFADDEITLRRIKKNSKKVYNFIKYRAYSGNAPYIEVLINKTEEGRKFIKDVLLEQFDADNETAFNDLSNQPAIDIASGREIEREKLWANQISVDTEQLIYSSSSYFGINIMIQYSFPPILVNYLKGGVE